MRHVDVRLLGPFEVAVDARGVAAPQWEHRRAQDLVKLLALSPAHRLTRDEVVEALWPHLDAKAGVANLYKAAHFARRALGWPDAVALKRGVVELAPGCRVDTDVQREIDAGWPSERAELLPDDRFEAWTEPHRERLAQDRAAALRGQGRWNELLSDDPTDEEATRALLRESAAAGDRVGAARGFRRLRDALATLGLAPSEETLSLWRELSRGDAVQATVPAGAPLVGRDRERDVVRATLDATARGTGGTLLLLGDPGIGKTRLVDLLLDDARARGWHTLRGAG
ncbi:MAG TPA: AAA family ATPase, partial [Solirubrobacter sp.]